jgi:hypothetical protein
MRAIKSFHRIFTAALFALGFFVLPNATAQEFLTNGLVAFYPFNGDANDATGNGNNGTVNNVAFVTDRFGNANSAADFQGNSSSFIVINTTNLNLNSPFTVSAWIEFPPGQGSGGPSIISTAGYNINTDLSPYERFVIMNCSTASLYSSTTVPADVWNQVVAVFGTNGLRLYLNGSLSSTVSANVSPSYAHGYKPAIGINCGSLSTDIYAGLIDDLRIYNRALSDAEVQQLYALEGPPLQLNIRKAVSVDAQGLKVGPNYILQVSSDLNNWTNSGSAFAATNSYWRASTYWDVDNWNQLFFRLQVAP